MFSKLKLKYLFILRNTSGTSYLQFKVVYLKEKPGTESVAQTLASMHKARSALVGKPNTKRKGSMYEIFYVVEKQN